MKYLVIILALFFFLVSGGLCFAEDEDISLSLTSPLPKSEESHAEPGLHFSDIGITYQINEEVLIGLGGTFEEEDSNPFDLYPPPDDDFTTLFRVRFLF